MSAASSLKIFRIGPILFQPVRRKPPGPTSSPPLPLTSRLGAHQQRIARAQGDALLRPYRLAGDKAKLEVPHEARQNDRGLLMGEGCAEAHARAGAEGNIGAALDFLGRARQKPARIEHIRIIP